MRHMPADPDALPIKSVINTQPQANSFYYFSVFE